MYASNSAPSDKPADESTLSGKRDSNPRPLHPKCSVLTGLNYYPNYTRNEVDFHYIIAFPGYVKTVRELFESYSSFDVYSMSKNNLCYKVNIRNIHQKLTEKNVFFAVTVGFEPTDPFGPTV